MTIIKRKLSDKDSPLSIFKGIQVQDAEGNALTNSTAAAKSAIAQVVFSRVGMAMPGRDCFPNLTFFVGFNIYFSNAILFLLGLSPRLSLYFS